MILCWLNYFRSSLCFCNSRVYVLVVLQLFKIFFGRSCELSFTLSKFLCERTNLPHLKLCQLCRARDFKGWMRFVDETFGWSLQTQSCLSGMLLSLHQQQREKENVFFYAIRSSLELQGVCSPLTHSPRSSSSGFVKTFHRKRLRHISRGCKKL